MDRYNNIFLVSTSEFVESWGASMSWKRVLRIKSHRSDQQWIDIFNKERTILFYACWYIIKAHKLNSCVNLESSFFLPFLQLFERQVDQVTAEQSRKKKTNRWLKIVWSENLATNIVWQQNNTCIFYTSAVHVNNCCKLIQTGLSKNLFKKPRWHLIAAWIKRHVSITG